MPDNWDYSRKTADPDNTNFVPILTRLIAAVCVLFTVANHTSQGMPIDSLWFRVGQFGHLPAFDIWDGHWAALFTSVFVHGSPVNLSMTVMHIGFNLVWLLRIGELLEETLNPLWYAIFFLGAAVVGSGAELAISGNTGVGASGVVYAMFGLLWAGRWRYRFWQEIATQQNFNLFVGWGAFCIVMTYLGWIRIANAAHFGGFLFGLSVGWLFLAKERKRLSIVILAGLISLTILSVTWMPWSPNWVFWKAYKEGEAGHYNAAINLYERAQRLGANPEAVRSNIERMSQLRDNPEPPASPKQTYPIDPLFAPPPPSSRSSTGGSTSGGYGETPTSAGQG